MKTFNHTRPMRDAEGNEVSRRAAPVWRMTVGELGGTFLRDKRRRLVVGLEAGDVISFRPEGTRQRVTVEAHRLYAEVLRWRAGREQLERARERKAQLAARRESRRLAAAERRLVAE